VKEKLWGKMTTPCGSAWRGGLCVDRLRRHRGRICCWRELRRGRKRNCLAHALEPALSRGAAILTGKLLLESIGGAYWVALAYVGTRALVA